MCAGINKRRRANDGGAQEGRTDQGAETGENIVGKQRANRAKEETNLAGYSRGGGRLCSRLSFGANLSVAFVHCEVIMAVYSPSTVSFSSSGTVRCFDLFFLIFFPLPGWLAGHAATDHPLWSFVWRGGRWMMNCIIASWHGHFLWFLLIFERRLFD